MSYTKDQIKAKLSTDNRWLIRGLIAIYNRQTIDEQVAKVTAHSNGIGFNGIDGPILSDFAQRAINGRNFSEKQIALVRKLMLKYSGQLSSIANNKG